MNLFNFLFRGGFHLHAKVIDDLRALVYGNRDQIEKLEFVARDFKVAEKRLVDIEVKLRKLSESLK
jgi:hypothetical protein